MEQEQSNRHTMNLLTGEQIKQLDPGIVGVVQWLRQMGFDTCESGDGRIGQHGRGLPVPYVHIKVTPDLLVSETDRLVRLLAKMGIEVKPTNYDGAEMSVESAYSPATGIGIISVFNVTLHPDQCDYGARYREGSSKEDWVKTQNERCAA